MWAVWPLRLGLQCFRGRRWRCVQRSVQILHPRLRHAMFRFNWPTSELLFGQYWSMFCEYYAESAEDGPMQMTGTPTARLPQIRFTQKFAGDWTVAALVGDPNQATLGSATAAAASNGAAAYGPYNLAMNNGQSRNRPRSRRRSPTPTTSGVRPPITASPPRSRPRSWPAGSAMSCGNRTTLPYQP